MADTNDLLVEIGTEELPPKALMTLSSAFADEISRGLHAAKLDFGTVERFATPRRLAVRIRSLVTTQPDQTLKRKGPAIRAAFDNEGDPTKAALGFARSCSVDLSAIGTEGEGKSARLVFTQHKQGAPTSDLLLDIIRHALKALPIPKRMRWSDLKSEFVRPVHWFVLLFGNDTVPGKILDVATGNITYGHRFHHPGPLKISQPSDYDIVLRSQGFVEPDFTVRRDYIRNNIMTLVSSLHATAIIDSDLLDEVCSLTEWPVAVMGSFDLGFLNLPSEALIETMQKNQKYFPVEDIEGNLKPNFITIANIESQNPDQVIAGNERVITPRFKDAAFFWDQDRKKPLDLFIPALSDVVYQKQLGSLFEKAQRLARLAGFIASEINVDETDAKRAALLCKCDLLTDMVGEFASLQGIMGKYYAESSGEKTDVCVAIEEHYLPKYAGDRLPTTQTGQVLALADKLDTLLGIFATGQKPTGVKDPFGLRRASLGVLRILIEIPIELDLLQLLRKSSEFFYSSLNASSSVDDVYKYIMDRLKPYYHEKNIPGSSVDAVLAVAPSIPIDIHHRIIAIEEFKKLSQSATLTIAHKRSNNILKKSALAHNTQINPQFFEENAERELYEKIVEFEYRSGPLMKTSNYSEILILLAGLKDPVDRFLDEVMVNVDDENIRNNRISLLNKLSKMFSLVADLSKLQN